MTKGASRFGVLILAFMLGLSPLASAESPRTDSLKRGPRVVHPTVGAGLSTERIWVTFVGRKQHFSAEDKATYDVDIQSPKSVNIHPSGEKYYVNSLEGGKTVVYDFQTGEKLKVISHQFSEEDLSLWAPPSGFYAFRHYHEHTETFTGKPVESTFSHGGRYLWVPYYRRSFDLNAQDPSAMAVIDTERDEIVRLFETGPLPKMVATSPDGKRLAVTHWGNNTVGLMDISSERPEDWYYMVNIIVDYQLNLNYSLTHKVDRDVDSGYCLRGTVFTPDNRFLFVGCMGSGGGIAVIDLENNTYLGRVMGAMSNLRHLVIRNGFLYASINSAGYVQRIPLAKFLAACSTLDGNAVKKVKVDGWVSCKVPAGARTIDLSPDNHFIFAACNFSSCLAVVDAVSMKLLGTIPADSYPVGLDVSLDGRYVFTTSQGRTTGGGNAVDIFEVTYQ